MLSAKELESNVPKPSELLEALLRTCPSVPAIISAKDATPFVDLPITLRPAEDEFTNCVNPTPAFLIEKTFPLLVNVISSAMAPPTTLN